MKCYLPHFCSLFRLSGYWVVFMNLFYLVLRHFLLGRMKIAWQPNHSSTVQLFSPSINTCLVLSVVLAFQWCFLDPSVGALRALHDAIYRFMTRIALPVMMSWFFMMAVGYKRLEINSWFGVLFFSWLQVDLRKIWLNTEWQCCSLG